MFLQLWGCFPVVAIFPEVTHEMNIIYILSDVVAINVFQLLSCFHISQRDNLCYGNFNSSADLKSQGQTSCHLREPFNFVCVCVCMRVCVYSKQEGYIKFSNNSLCPPPTLLREIEIFPSCFKFRGTIIYGVHGDDMTSVHDYTDNLSLLFMLCGMGR